MCYFFTDWFCTCKKSCHYIRDWFIDHRLLSPLFSTLQPSVDFLPVNSSIFQYSAALILDAVNSALCTCAYL